MFEPVDPKTNFPKMEEEILKFWEENKVFEASVQQKDDASEFVFYDGPPFATGLPHFGHFVPGTIKDSIPRYKTMRGFKVERRFGWDCHGLPIEYEMEKELGISGKKQIEDFGVAKFNESCRSIVLRYTKEWRTIMTRAGRWVDFDHDYKTMDPDYMESIWWVVNQLWDKDLIYEGHYILPYCPRCSTVLSNHELQLGGYKDVHDPAITVRFRVTKNSGTDLVDQEDNPIDLADGSTFILAWTTTPWTLPSNLALATGSDIDYVLVQDGDERYILAETRLLAYYKEDKLPTILKRFKGSALKGTHYEPLFPYFAELANKGAFTVHTADFVTTEDGTGIVHIAPGFGEDDYQVLKGTGIPTVCPVDAECKFTSEITDYQGIFVKDADKAIIERLKQERKLLKREQYLHAYPYCWRCSSPLIYRAVSSWFVKIDPIKEKMLKANQEIYWMPAHIKNGRFGKWLENARDWAISRNRYWGNPLPIWKCEACGKTECLGSRAELEQKTGKTVTDLHKHFVDEYTWNCSCGGTMKRIPEVLDCWFESGSMPYAQVHYPFENKKHFEEHFPADFIAEGLDQTRGWFYTLTILAAALFDRPAFKACVVNGLVLASDGKKMSKSLRNYTDPMKVMQEFGADALRLFLMNSAVTRADDLCYSDDGVREILKNLILPLWSAYSFFVTYIRLDKVTPPQAKPETANPLDRWILSLCESMVQNVTDALETYDMQKAIVPIINFIDALNNWFIRRSRRRFWRSENDSDKLDAYAALYRVLIRLIHCLAPFAPFVTEKIWLNLRPKDSAISIHLSQWPLVEKAFIDLNLETKMQYVRNAVAMGRALRYQHNIKIRQPLKEVQLVTKNQEEKASLLEMLDIIKEELNVKDAILREDEEQLVEYSAKANFRVLGKELGKDMNTAATIIEQLGNKEIMSLLEGNTLVIDVAGRSVPINSDKVVINRIEKANLKVINEGSLTVALNTDITEELFDEGNVRDLIRGIQNLRKETGLAVSDRINLIVFGSGTLKRGFDKFKELITTETLATNLNWGKIHGMSCVDAGEETWEISLKKA